MHFVTDSTQDGFPYIWQWIICYILNILQMFPDFFAEILPSCTSFTPLPSLIEGAVSIEAPRDACLALYKHSIKRRYISFSIINQTLLRRVACLKFGHSAPNSEFQNYTLNTEFVDAVCILIKQIASRKLKQFFKTTSQFKTFAKLFLPYTN